MSAIDSTPHTSTYLNSKKVKDLLITGFSLTKYDPASMQQLMSIDGSNQTASTSHPLDSWSLTGLGLSAGSYFLKVEGNVIGNGGGTYGGDLTVSAVPEPETYAMLLAGLGLLGFAARRKAANKAV
ncbi:FxDxF family PEP-CTERM protein [Janthinobacterium sp.]|uniref:FxDxF family PEP-CTERM protein n=1 Tax=Janthinobacterium sp. TaxID=1871054 RepID=UPI00293D1F3E|nr:FxDxF family PEP-CTERM protein [Janthinobacterium sp.]